MPEIRSLTSADYAAVAAMSADAMVQGLVGLPTWETAEDVARALQAAEHGEFIVAVDEDGQVIGVAGYELRPDGAAWIYGPLVKTRGIGTGAWLAGKIESVAAHKGAQSYAMLIGLKNKAGQAWAEWRGYLLDDEYPETLLVFAPPGEVPAAPAVAEGEVRPARPGDLDRIYDLFTASFPTEFVTAQVWQGWLPQCHVIEVDGAVVGFVRIDEQGFLHHVCVDAGYRRRGLSRKLMAEALAAAKARSVVRAEAAVRLDNTAGVELLRSLGFTREIPVGKWVRREG